MTMVKHVIALAAVLLLAGGVFAAEHPASKEKAPKGSGMLDGQKFVGTMGITGEEGNADTLIFKKGTFVSTACTEYGFMKAPYKAEKADDGKITFTAEVQNEAGETMSWSGVVEGKQLNATAINTSESGKTEYTYKGKRKAKDKKPEHPSSEHPQ